ncbi:MAG: tRNA (adenosine(37)-N6)-threonylcarbamoyltransferase complex dimerization subunit type 1 TsaB [Candidatus Omnitrophica bacterium]|nr:tRNA (adenosine(37)-N6)-threonylcarbamoyltransferase complex dimerization subunit type 1 TsaB [Candidatus Omnitrophota bacterium]
MYFLSFETSTKIFSLALNRDEKVLRFRNIKSALVLEDAILPAVDRILNSAGVKFKDLDGFAIALGPGSFTSLRVGLATVKAFVMATGRPVVGIPSLDIIAQGVSLGDCDEICVLNDARRGKVYAALYALQGRKSDYLLTSLDDVLKKAHGKTLFVGDALGIYRTDIEKAYLKYVSQQCKCLFADEKWWYPQSRIMAALAFKRFSKKQYDDAATLLPLYLYPQDCQVSKDKKNG